MKPELHHFFSSWVVSEFRANGGRLGAPFTKAELILLTTFPPGSQRPRTSPVRFIPWRSELVLVAAGPATPWYQDLLSWPRGTVEDGHDTYDVLAAVIQNADRAPLLELARGSDSAAADTACETSGETTDDIAFVRLVRVDEGADVATHWTRGDEFLQGRERIRYQLAELQTAAEKLLDGDNPGGHIPRGDNPGSHIPGSGNPSSPHPCRDNSVPGDALVLHARCLRFCAALTELLSTEDRELLPVLGRAVPGFDASVPELRRCRTAVREALERFTHDTAARQADRAAWVADLTALAELFGRQFRCESTRIVPALNSPGYARATGNADDAAH